MILLVDCINKMIDLCDLLIPKKHTPSINVDIKPHTLKDAIAICKKAISDRPTHPVLANFLLVAKHGKITLTATNLDTFIEVSLDGEIKEDGAVCIPALLFEKIVGAIAKTTKKKSFYCLNLSQKNEKVADRYGNTQDQPLVTVSYKSSKQLISCLSADEFPATPDIVGQTYNIPGLVENFKKLKPHCSTDATKNTLQAVNIGNRRMVATDGHRVAVKKINSNVELVIPATTKTAKAKHWLEHFIDPSFIIDELPSPYGYIKFFENQITVTQRMLEGRNFATDWNIPTSETVVAIISKRELSSINRELEIFKMCAQTDGLTNKDTFDIWLELKDGQITIKSCTELLENSYTLTYGNSVVNKLIYVDAKKFMSLLETATQDIEICVDNEYGLIAMKQDDLLLGIMLLERMKKEVGRQVITAKGCGYAPAINLPYYITTNSLVVDRNCGDFRIAETLFFPYHIFEDGTKRVIVNHSGFCEPETLNFPYMQTKDGIVVTRNRPGFCIADDLPYVYSDNTLTVLWNDLDAGFYSAERIWSKD